MELIDGSNDCNRDVAPVTGFIMNNVLLGYMGSLESITNAPELAPCTNVTINNTVAATTMKLLLTIIYFSCIIVNELTRLPRKKQPPTMWAQG
jgi:phosphoribosylcarboxyaminoimidazole (NCAIR) mutase